MESATASGTQAHRRTAEVVVEPPKRWPGLGLTELWEHRDLMYVFARRDIAVRYRQAVIGLFWALLQPILLAAVFSVFLSLLAKVPSGRGIPYPLFALTGMVMWLFLTSSLQETALSTVKGAALISKVSFPRIAVPLAALAPPMVDFGFGFLVVVVVAIGFGFPPQIEILAAPIAFAFALITALGAGLWLSALNVKYRDIVLLVPFLTQLGLFITPVIYPISLVPQYLQPLYALNPAVGAVELFRWALLPTEFPGVILLVSFSVSAVWLVTGFLYFRRAEQYFADLI